MLALAYEAFLLTLPVGRAQTEDESLIELPTDPQAVDVDLDTPGDQAPVDQALAPTPSPTPTIFAPTPGPTLVPALAPTSIPVPVVPNLASSAEAACRSAADTARREEDQFVEDVL